MLEYSQGASGKPTKPIEYDSPAMKNLQINYNPGIVFEHMPERSGDTRMMTKVCTCTIFDKLYKPSHHIFYMPVILCFLI